MSVKKSARKQKGSAVPQEFLTEGKQIKDYASLEVLSKDEELGPYEYEHTLDEIKTVFKDVTLVDGHTRQ